MKLLILIAAFVGLAVAQVRRDSRCPPNEDPRNPTQFAHPTDCGRFIKCARGNAIELPCPNGQHWNARRSYCDSPQNAQCFSVDRRPPIPQRPQTPVLTPQRPNVPRVQIEHPDFLDCPFPDIPGRVFFYPYHLNCSQFYQCVNGRAVLLRCPAGTSWDLRTNHCAMTHTVICATPRRPL